MFFTLKLYPRSKEERTSVEDDQVSWRVKFDAYKPHEYTSDTVSGKGGKPIPEWADTEKVRYYQTRHFCVLNIAYLSL